MLHEMRFGKYHELGMIGTWCEWSDDGKILTVRTVDMINSKIVRTDKYKTIDPYGFNSLKLIGPNKYRNLNHC